MGDWDTPPTSAEHAAASDPWSTPPTPSEAQHSKSLGNSVVDTLGSIYHAINDAYHGGLGAIGGAVGIPDALKSMGMRATTPEEDAASRKAREVPGILEKDSPDWLAAANAFVSGMPGSDGGAIQSPEAQARAARFTQERPWSSLGLGMAGGAAYPAPGGVAGGPISRRLQGASRAMETGAEELAARVPSGTAGSYSAMTTAKRQGMGKLLLDEGAISPSSLNLRSVAKKLPELEQRMGSDLSDSIGALDQTGGQFNKRDLLNRFLELADEQRAKGPGGANVRDKYLNEAKAIANDIEENGPMTSFAGAEGYKQGYQEPINFAKAHKSPLEMGSIEVSSAARQAVEDAAQTAAEGANNPGLLQNFLDAKKRSGYAQTANEMTNAPGGSIGRLEARGMIGPTARMGGWMAATGLMVAGHPLGALAAVALPPVAQALKSRAIGAMALTARSSSEMLANLAATQPERLGRFAGILRPALNNGSGNMDEFNARSYALSQTEPEFQALTKQLGEQGNH